MLPWGITGAGTGQRTHLKSRAVPEYCGIQGSSVKKTSSNLNIFGRGLPRHYWGSVTLDMRDRVWFSQEEEYLQDNFTAVLTGRFVRR